MCKKTNTRAKCQYTLWHRGVMIITTAKNFSARPELRFCAGSNSVFGVLEICNGENLWQ